MEATLIRERLMSALIVGAAGRNVLRIVTAFEAKRIFTLRADDIAGACERLVVDMPHVVLCLVAPADDAERDALVDRATAVGALLVHVDPLADDGALQDLLDRTIEAAIHKKMMREAADLRAASGASDLPPPEELDEGWDG